MPGFNINGQGGGPQGLAEVRRTHRWIFRAMGNRFPQDSLLFLKTASRPSMSFDEAEMDHNQETVYLAGKHHWEPVTMTFYDVENPDMSKEMYAWLQGGNESPFDILPSMNINAPKDYKVTGNLDMIDGHANPTDSWTLYQCWPQAVNWNGLDYSSSELQLIEVTMRYDRAVKDV